MDWKITEEQQLLLESCDQFIAQMKEKGYDEEYFRDCDHKMRYPIEYMAELMQSGIGTLAIPEEHGGGGVDAVTLMLVAEHMGRQGYDSGAGTALSITDMLEFGSPEQVAFVSQKVKEGKGGFSLGITEPGAGSDNNAMITTATDNADGTVTINGTKSFVTNGDNADYLLVVARDAEPVDPKLWASMWFVPVNAKGVSTSPMNKIGWKDKGNMCEVHFDNVVVDKSALVGKRGQGFLQLMKNFEIERLVICVGALGVAEHAMDFAAAYTSQRVAFGKNIGSFQLIQEMLCENEIEIMNMRNMVLQVASMFDNKENIRIEVNLAKYYVARAACKVVDNCLQIMGGIGYIDDCPISKDYRDIRAYRLGGDTDQIMIHIAGRLLVKKYAQK